ncbi:MAG: sugar phosphate isomerase/epimerase [Clostridia bacterium]|nr:sugar phosphate isomerase/epimerase [Clostridia bacterium]
MTPKLSVWSSFYHEMSPEDAILELKKHGITATEFSIEHADMLFERGNYVTEAARFADFAKEKDFEISQGHLWHDCEFCAHTEHYERLLDWLVLFDAMGIKNAVLHPDRLLGTDMTFEEKLELNVKRLNDLAAFMKGRGMKMRICLENLKKVWVTIDDMMALLDRLDPEFFGICLDTSHLYLREGDIREFIIRSGERLHALHIGENDGSADQHLMPYVVGRIDFADVLSALREVGYDGLFNLEIPGENRAPVEIRGYKAEYIKRCYENISEV